MSIPIITDSDSVFELSIQDSDPLVLVQPPFTSLSPSKLLETMKLKLSAQNSLRVEALSVWHKLCDNSLWSEDLLSI